MHRVRVRNLKDESGVAKPPVLYCRCCGAEYSAHRGDYFLADPEHVFKCCRRNLRLVRVTRVITEISGHA